MYASERSSGTMTESVKSVKVVGDVTGQASKEGCGWPPGSGWRIPDSSWNCLAIIILSFI